jgi:hypothetical protein
MNERESFDLRVEHTEAPQAPVMRPRAAESPLSTEVSSPAARFSEEEKDEQLTPPPQNRASQDQTLEAAQSPGVQRAVKILRSVLPLAQRLLPLLDGNIGTTVSNFLAPRPQPKAPHPPGDLDLAPIEDSLAKLRSQHHSLRLQVTEQNASLKRVEDQLEKVREATNRNTLEQQELQEDLKAFGKKVKIVVIFALVLAAASFCMTLVLFLRLNKVIH